MKTPPIQYNDYPFDKVAKKAVKLLKQHPNLLIHQKYTCAGCGARLGIDEPNVFYETGTCDKCDAVTNIRKQGCNYMIHMKSNRGRV